MKNSKFMGRILFLVALTLCFSFGKAMAEDMNILEGKIVSLDKTEILVKTSVAGLTGPMDKDFLFSVGDDATIEICWGKRCDPGMAKEGLAILKDFEYFVVEGLSPAGKDVSINANSKNEVTHLKIQYPNSIAFIPYDALAPF